MKKIVILLSLALFIFPITKGEPSYPIEEAFVTFATGGSYMQLLEILVKSVHAFSSRPIVAFGVNTDVPFSTDQYPRLIKKRIDVNLKDFPIYYQKSRIIAESGIKYGVYVEADDIVNKNVDDLFTYARYVTEYPLCPIHPGSLKRTKELADILGIEKPSMPYVHGHITFSPKCRQFIEEWVQACYKYKDVASKTDFDETVLNVLLWKYKATRYLPIYDPYFTAWRDYIKGIRDPLYLYYMCHGAKEIHIAQHLLHEMINYNKTSRSDSSNVIQETAKVEEYQFDEEMFKSNMQQLYRSSNLDESN